jgi:nucleoside-diphosphate-sugar epimerase
VKVLLTGDRGYIGAVTGPFLRAAGHEVAGVDAGFYSDGPRRDVRDLGPGDLEGLDAVVHLAGLSNDPLGDVRPELTAQINLDATVRLARSAREAGVRRFVFASSCSMYGTAGAGDVVGEEAPLRPLTAYAESKVRSEEAVAALADRDFAPVFMRNATVYGASPSLRLDLVLNNLVGWAYTTGRVRILSDGTPWRPLVHVEDVARATAALLAADEAAVRGEAFNVGRDEENYQVRDLAEIVADVVLGTIEYAGGGDPDPRSYRVDFGKLARAFPDAGLRWTARAGAEELLAAYRGIGLTLGAFEGPRFVRLKRLRELLDSDALDADLRWR